jgi:uncharacterized protein YkwD
MFGPGVRARPRACAATLLALSLVVSFGLIDARPVAAATNASIGSQLVGWVNQARASRGLRALRVDARLGSLAFQRASVLSDAGLLDHSLPGDIGRQIDGAGIRWYRYGEVLAWSSATYGSPSAWAIFTAWRGSPSHWTLLMSSDFNYLGPGVSVRQADGATYASILLTESPDHTAPAARIDDASRYGATVTWRWHGWDPPLQTHTAGIANFDVQYRTDDGSWATVRTATTSTALRLYGRASGHTYGVRVRTRDRRGTVSAWSAEVRIQVP